MDKFLTFPNSRIPIWQSDFAFIQNSMMTSIALAVKPMLKNGMRIADKVILYGCDVSKDNNEYRTTAGLVLINGELLEVQASTQGENFEDTPTFVLDETYDPDGNRMDFAGNSRQCYAIRRAKLGIGSSSSDVYYRLSTVHKRVQLDSGILVYKNMSEKYIYINANFNMSASSGLGKTLILSKEIYESSNPDLFRNFCQAMEWNPDYADSGTADNDYPFIAMSMETKRVYPAYMNFYFSYHSRKIKIEIYLLEEVSGNQIGIKADCLL